MEGLGESRGALVRPGPLADRDAGKKERFYSKGWVWEERGGM